MQHKINYKRIFTLLGISISIVAIVLYVALTENEVEEYPFIGDWNCKQKDSVVEMHLKITDSFIFENGKKLPDYYPKTSKVKEKPIIFIMVMHDSPELKKSKKIK